ncbi:MAG: hypothetical protein RLZZ04_3970 [Cyanobacteriota bacterium]|jgi:hypothetical protein
MPIVTVQGKTLTCEDGTNLRQVLLQHDINLLTCFLADYSVTYNQNEHL